MGELSIPVKNVIEVKDQMKFKVLGESHMVNVNGQKVEWKQFPEGWYLTDVQYHILWKNEDTGAMFLLLKVPVGGVAELPHTHPQADQMGFVLSAKAIRDDGTTMSYGESNYSFGYRPKDITHGPRKGSKIKFTQETIVLQYFDGPPTKLNEGETKELTLE